MKRKTTRQLGNISTTRSQFGYRGIDWFGKKQKFRARIGTKYTRRSLGYFDSVEDAARAYDAAVRSEYGQGAAVNFPDDGERRVLVKVKPNLCPSGHDLRITGYVPPNGERVNCRECNKASVARYKARKCSIEAPAT